MAAASSGALSSPFTNFGNPLTDTKKFFLDDDNKTKVTTKSHQHGWIARKLFRRSTTLKAKATYKPLTRKKSLAGIPLLSEGEPKNTIKGNTLEEIGRLGGLGILALPHDFAVDKLTLPTCLSATATYLCQHGKSGHH